MIFFKGKNSKENPPQEVLQNEIHRVTSDFKLPSSSTSHGRRTRASQMINSTHSSRGVSWWPDKGKS